MPNFTHFVEDISQGTSAPPQGFTHFIEDDSQQTDAASVTSMGGNAGVPPQAAPIQSPWEMYSKPSPRPTAPLPTLMPAPPAPRPKPVSTWNPTQAAQDEFNKHGPMPEASGYVLPADKPAPAPVFPSVNLQEFGPTKPFEQLPAPVDRHIVPVGSNGFELSGPHAPRVAMKPLPTGVLADLGVMAGGLDAPPGSALSNASIAHAMSPESQEEIDAREKARKDAEKWAMYPGDVHGRQRAEKPLLPVVMNKLDTLDRKIAGPELSDDEIKQIYKGQGVELQTKEDIDKAKKSYTDDPLRIVLDMYKDAAPEKLAEIKDRGMSISNFMRGTMGAGREIADSLSSPSNLAIMGALSIKGTPKLVQVIANGKFSYDQAKAALEGFQQGYAAYKNGDALTATKEWTAAPVNAFFAVMTGKHAVEGGLELRKTAVPAIKQTVGDVRDALNQAHESVMRSGEPRNDSPYAIVGHDAETGLPIMRRKAPGRAATDQSWQSAHVLDTTAAPEASIPAEIREPRDQGTKGPGEDVHATVSQETGATPGQPVAGVAPPIGAVEPETGRPVLQASPRPEVNQAAATAEHPEIKDAIAKAIRPVNGAKISGARAEKDAGRRDEKIEEGGQSPRTVRDYSGYRIAVDSFAARDQVLAALRGIFEVHGEQDHFEDGDPEHGFHAYTLNVREPGSPVSHEVQILPREVAVTADTRHGVYERAREGDPKAAAELKAANAADWQRFQARQTPVAQGARLQGVDGKKTVLHGVGDSVRPATYRLVEADDLMPSHNAFTFEENPGFEKGEQERDYKNSKEAQSRVLNQSGENFEPRYLVTDNPDAVNGPPVIYPNGKVAGGASRVMTIQRVYADGRGDVYRDALRQDAAHYSYTPENVDAMRQPVLVREIDYPANLDESQRLGSELNKSKTGALGGSEQAVSAGAKLRPETLNTVANWLAEDDSTLRELLRKRGLPILQMLVEDGALTDRERPGYLDHGALNDKGKDFIEQALLGHVVNDARLLDVAPKSILDKIEKSMGSISSIGARPDEWNLIRAVRPALLRAVAEHTTSAANGVPIELTLEQQALFGPGRNPVVDALVRVLNEKPTVVRDKFKAFAQDAGQNQPGQFSLLPGQEAFDAFNHAFGSTLTDEEFRNGIDELFTRPAAAETAAAKSQPSADTRQGEALPGESGRDGQRPSIPSTGGATQAVERAGAVPGGDAGVVERFRAGMEAQRSGVRGQGSEKPAAEPKYKFASTQHNIAPDSEAGRALDAARERVAEADLAGDGKNIDGNHVTVRYGLKGDLTPDVQSFIEGLSPFDATLGTIEAFKPSEHSDGAAPLIAPVNSSELARINQEIAKHGEFTEPSFAEYKPHATVAYVKPEAAEKYVGDKSTAGKKFRVDSIAVTDRNGNQTEIQLKGKATGAGGDVRGPADREIGATGPDDRGFPKGTRVLADGREGVVKHPPYAVNGGLPRARVRLDAVGGKPGEMLRSVKPEEMEKQGPGDQGTKGPGVGGDARGPADREVGAIKPVQQGQAPAGERKPVGEPLPARIQQIKEIAATGQKVVIFSVDADNPALHEALRAAGLGDLPVTNLKGNDFGTLLDNQVDELSNVNHPMQIPPIPKGKALYVDFDGTLFKQKQGSGVRDQGLTETRLPENQGRAVLQDSPEQTMLGNPREQGSAGTAGPLTPLRSAQDDIVSDMERERAEQVGRKAKRDNDHTMANGVGLTENAARHQTKVEEQAGRKAVVLDAHGEGVWHRLFAGSSDLGAGKKWYGMRLTASGVKKALIKLGKAIANKENTPEARDGFARMAKAIRDAQQPDGGASILRGDYHADTAREEAWHNWQFEHNFHESYALASVADQPEFADAMERLRGMGYRDLEKRMLAMEAMAKALGGDREFHISDEQREDLVRAFLSEALDEKGAEILQNMPHVDPRVRGIVEELRRNHAQESIQENRRGAEPAARGGSGADSGRGSNGRGEGLYADPANFRERADAGVERGVSKDGAEGELNKGQGSGVRDQDLLFQRFRAGLDRRKGVESHALPGMEGDVEAQRTAAAEDQGRQLTERMREPGRNISRKAGEMERESPLFRDTDASGMGTLFGERGSGGAGDQGTLFQRVSEDKEAVRQNPWFLKSAKVLDAKMRGPMAGGDLLRMLENNGVKPDEIKWSGLEDLRGAARVTPEDVREHLAANAITIKEVRKGGSAKEARGDFSESNKSNETKFFGKQLPGGDNYRELLMTLPPTGRTHLKSAASIRELPDGKFEAIVEGDSVGRFATRAEAERQAELFHGYGATGKKLTKSDDFRSSHWDEPNVLGHVRFNDRTGPNGEKLLHVEELQSDWHQKGREKGYITDEILTARSAFKSIDDKISKLRDAAGLSKWNENNDLEWNRVVGNLKRVSELEKIRQTEAYKQWEDAVKEKERLGIELQKLEPYDKVPDAPFKKTWPELLFKRMVRYAAENGYDGISWTPGEQQAERYDLSKQVSEIVYGEDNRLIVNDLDHDVIYNDIVSPEKLPDVIGKEAAQKLIDAEPTHRQDDVSSWAKSRRLYPEDLKVGGEGMKGFYDKIVPEMANKLGKPFGARVGETFIPLPDPDDFDEKSMLPDENAIDEGGYHVPYLPVTDAMKRSVLSEGQPLFQKRGEDADPSTPLRSAQDDREKIDREVGATRVMGADSSIQDEMREWKRSEDGQLRSYPTVEAWKAARDAKLKEVMAAAKARDDAAAADAAKNKQPVPDAAALEARREVERAAEKQRWKEEFETRAANKKAQPLKLLIPMPLWKEAMGAFKDWRDDKPTAGMEFREMAREKQGQMDREVLQKKKELEEDRKRFVTMPHEDVTELIDQIQHGRYDQMKPEHRKIFEPLGEMWEQTRARMQALKPELLQNYYEHYFPQLWARPGRVARLMSGKRSLFSPSGFLKSRTIPTFREGIEYGLEPKTWNPLDTVLMQYAAERKYLRDLEMVDDMRRHGMLRAFKSEKDAPDGWEKLDDRFATKTKRVTVIDEHKVVDATYDKTYAKGTEGQGLAIPSIATENLRKASRPMTVIEGYYFAPKQIARSFNNMVSKGLHGRMSAIDAAFDINKSMNAVQLAMSAFHATASTINLAIGDIALGLEQGGQALDAGIQGLKALKSGLKSGDMADVRARFGEALGRGASAAGHAVRGATMLGPVARHLWVGDRVIAEYLKPGAAAKYAAEANWIARAGARPEQALNLQPAKWRQVVEDIRRGDWFKGAKGAIPGTIDLAGSWLMRGMIPRIKYGAMQDMAHNILAEAARRDWSDEETRRRMQDAWDSIDNRYGQMVYGNKFWNRIALELAQLGIRSVGWQGGTYMEYGGAVGDTMKAAARVAAGKRPELTHKMAFALATPIFTGAFAAAATYLLTGHKPDTEKYGLKAYGMVEMPDGTMLSIPGYSKNLMSLGEDIRQNTVPYRTAINTASPFLSSTLEMMQNKDYYGNQIRNEDDPVIAKDLGKSQAGEYAKFAASQFMPFTLKSFLEQRSRAGAGEFAEIGMGQSGGQGVLSYLGFQPATRVMTNSPAMNLAQHYHEETPTAARTAEQAARSKTVHNLIHTLEQGHMVTLEEAEARGVTREQYHRVLNELHYTPLARAVSGLKTFEQAREVWQKATPEERAGLQEVMEKKARKEVETVYQDSGDAAADEFEAKLKEQGITQ